MNFLIGTGRYKGNDEFERIWWQNQPKTPKAKCVVVTCVGGMERVFTWNTISLPGNLGHIGDLLNGSKPHSFCGWSASFMQLAMTAYCAELDFIYKEEDCLAFGPWVQKMYEDMGDGNMVFGGPMKSPPYMPCAQSLVLIRHGFIPDFVWRYLGMGNEASTSNLPEHKFAKMLADEPNHFRRLSFGVDRERPLPYDAPVWYAQKFSPEELDELRKRKLI